VAKTRRGRNQRRRERKEQKSQKHKRILLFIAVTIVTVLLVGFPVYQANKSRPETTEDALNRLLLTHPHEEIRENLYQLSLSEQALILFVPSSQMPDRDASFRLLGPSDAYFKDGQVRNVTSLLPLFTFQEEFISGSLSDSIKQTLILHEYQHYLQWKAGTFPEHLLFIGSRVQTAEDMEIIYEIEVEAYTKQCEFAVVYVEHHTPEDLSVCAEFAKHNIPGFRKTIAKVLREQDVEEEPGKFDALLFELAERSN
jgi:hypothetical protein